MFNKAMMFLAGLALGLGTGIYEVNSIKHEAQAAVESTSAEIAKLASAVNACKADNQTLVDGVKQWSDLADQHSEQLVQARGKDGSRTILQAVKPSTMWIIPGKIVPTLPDQTAAGVYRFVDGDGTSTMWMHPPAVAQ